MDKAEARRRTLKAYVKSKTAALRDPLDYGKKWPCPFWPMHIRGAKAGLPRGRVDAARWRAEGVRLVGLGKHELASAWIAVSLGKW